ncbi:type VI secretion system protein TssL, long form [Marinobacter sp. M1N3S26]|uniref:type VI secretion system protein TssL, long form n=1 Tax=Marinobacter sp. M1N3S26 TaxID=3382299 RepID=UPI00387B41D0
MASPVLTRRTRVRHKGGAPSWIVTFADLATLLLTFFILLLSFAEMDLNKYKAMAQSMAVAFGSANVVAEDIGGSPLTMIESDTVSLPEPPDSPREEAEFIDDRGAAPDVTQVPEGIVDLSSRLIAELEDQVADESLSVNYDPQQVVIRFSEQATFNSGEAEIKPQMLPIIDRVVDVLSQCSGDIIVAGYTDDVPITSSRFRSNWDLSAARAVSVVHELVMNRQIPADRVIAAGRAETQPLAPNTTPENRALNRRVEIAIRDPGCQDSAPTEDLPVEVLP